MKEPFKGKTRNTGTNGRLEEHLEVGESPTGQDYHYITTWGFDRVCEWQRRKGISHKRPNNHSVNIWGTLPEMTKPRVCGWASLLRRGKRTIPSKRCYDIHRRQWNQAKRTKHHQTGTRQVQGPERQEVRKALHCVSECMKDTEVNHTLLTDLDLLSHNS